MNLFFSCKFPTQKQSRAGKRVPVERVHVASRLPGCMDSRAFLLPTSSSPSERQQLKACHPFSAHCHILRLRHSLRPQCTAWPSRLRPPPLTLLQFPDPGPDLCPSSHALRAHDLLPQPGAHGQPPTMHSVPFIPTSQSPLGFACLHSQVVTSCKEVIGVWTPFQ